MSHDKPPDGHGLERIVAAVVAVWVIALVSYMILSERTFDPARIYFLKIMLSLSCGIIVATLPGFFNLDFDLIGISGRAAGGAAVFIFVYTQSPKIELLGISEPPTEDIVRIADFTKSGCKDGKKSDIATFTDTYTVLNPPAEAHPYVIVARARQQPIKQSVRLFDLNSSATNPIPPFDTDTTDGSLTIYRWHVVLKDNKARVRWEWKNGHLSDNEGFYLVPLTKVRNIDAQYELPPGIEVTLATPHPAVAAANCGPAGSNRITCTNLQTTDDITLPWKWTMWSKCPNAPPE